ncbi:MAG: hypothetical protein MHM6MM_003300 [Cercozoa sp. M6MM]
MRSGDSDVYRRLHDDTQVQAQVVDDYYASIPFKPVVSGWIAIVGACLAVGHLVLLFLDFEVSDAHRFVGLCAVHLLLVTLVIVAVRTERGQFLPRGYMDLYRGTGACSAIPLFACAVSLGTTCLSTAYEFPRTEEKRHSTLIAVQSMCDLVAFVAFCVLAHRCFSHNRQRPLPDAVYRLTHGGGEQSGEQDGEERRLLRRQAHVIVFLDDQVRRLHREVVRLQHGASTSASIAESDADDLEKQQTEESSMKLRELQDSLAGKTRQIAALAQLRSEQQKEIDDLTASNAELKQQQQELRIMLDAERQANAEAQVLLAGLDEQFGHGVVQDQASEATSFNSTGPIFGRSGGSTPHTPHTPS